MVRPGGPLRTVAAARATARTDAQRRRRQEQEPRGTGRPPRRRRQGPSDRRRDGELLRRACGTIVALLLLACSTMRRRPPAVATPAAATTQDGAAGVVSGVSSLYVEAASGAFLPAAGGGEEDYDDGGEDAKETNRLEEDQYVDDEWLTALLERSQRDMDEKDVYNEEGDIDGTLFLGSHGALLFYDEDDEDYEYGWELIDEDDDEDDDDEEEEEGEEGEDGDDYDNNRQLGSRTDDEDEEDGDGEDDYEDNGYGEGGDEDEDDDYGDFVEDEDVKEADHELVQQLRQQRRRPSQRRQQQQQQHRREQRQRRLGSLGNDDVVSSSSSSSSRKEESLDADDFEEEEEEEDDDDVYDDDDDDDDVYEDEGVEEDDVDDDIFVDEEYHGVYKGDLEYYSDEEEEEDEDKCYDRDRMNTLYCRTRELLQQQQQPQQSTSSVSGGQRQTTQRTRRRRVLDVLGICRDSPLSFKVNSKYRRSCAWVRDQKTRQRCRWNRGLLATHCPRTCRRCAVMPSSRSSVLCKNAVTNWQLTVRNENPRDGSVTRTTVTKNCAWLRKQWASNPVRFRKYCAMRSVRYTCRALCGLCRDSGIFATIKYQKQQKQQQQQQQKELQQNSPEEFVNADPTSPGDGSTEDPSSVSSASSSPSTGGGDDVRGRNGRRRKPNILLILADDVGTGDIPFWWKRTTAASRANVPVDMPNLKHLAERGIVFMDAHATPKCSSTRYMLLSGNYPHRSRSIYTHNYLRDEGMFSQYQRSIADALKQSPANYHTAMFGKWHLGEKFPPDGKKDKKFVLSAPQHNWKLQLIEGPEHIGFDVSYMTLAGIQSPPYAFFDNGYLVPTMNNVRYWLIGEYQMPGGTSIIMDQRLYNDEHEIGFNRSGEGDITWDSTSYNMVLVNQTEAFIQKHKRTRPDDPFFAYVALTNVHIPHSPPDRYMDGTPVRGRYQTLHKDLLFEMDKVVGSLVAMVENDEELVNNTIIIFTTDNGGLNPMFGNDPSGPLRGYKSDIYEGGHRVPLIIRADGRYAAGETRTHLVGLNDIYATLCEIAGVPIPYGSGIDSISFADYLVSNQNTNLLRADHYASNLSPDKAGKEALRWGKMKLLCWHTKGRRFHKCELYDLSEDLGEEKNIINQPSMRIVVRKMIQKLKAVGPCPDDVMGRFQIGAFGKRRWVDCSFFEQNKRRCKWYWQGEVRCNSICGRYNRRTCSKSDNNNVLNMRKNMKKNGMMNTIMQPSMNAMMSSGAMKAKNNPTSTAMSGNKNGIVAGVLESNEIKLSVQQDEWQPGIPSSKPSSEQEQQQEGIKEIQSPPKTRPKMKKKKRPKSKRKQGGRKMVNMRRPSEGAKRRQQTMPQQGRKRRPKQQKKPKRKEEQQPQAQKKKRNDENTGQNIIAELGPM